MLRQPDDLETIDAEDDMRGIRYIEREKSPAWLVAVASTLLAAGIAAAWTANARLSSLEAQVSDLKEQVVELRHLLEPRYQGAPNGH